MMYFDWLQRELNERQVSTVASLACVQRDANTIGSFTYDNIYDEYGTLVAALVTILLSQAC